MKLHSVQADLHREECVKSVVALVILLCSFGLSEVHAAGAATRPDKPQNTCGVAPAPSDPGYAAFQACETNYMTKLDEWTKNESVMDYLSDSTTGPKLDSNGNLTVTAPASLQTEVQTGVNGVKTHLANDSGLTTEHGNMQVQSGLQATESARLQNLTETSATGSLNQVQQNNQVAFDYYNNSAGILAKYSDSVRYAGDLNNGPCASTTPDYSACAKAAAGYAASVAYDDMADQANRQAAEFENVKIQTCLAQKTISMNKVSCDSTDPNSPIYNPNSRTPPSVTWFDPYTGLCLPTAPQNCKEMFKAINDAAPTTSGTSTPSLRICPGGGTACITTIEKTTTPLGVKYTFKSKIGKSYSYYSSDVKDEKSLIKAGLSAAQAKSLLAEINETKSLVEKKAAKISGGFSKMAQVAKSALGISDDDPSKKKEDPSKAKPETKITTQPITIQGEPKRRPSMEGLSRELNGDFIGVKGDNIFKMINRRYQDKEQQLWFFGQYQ